MCRTRALSHLCMSLVRWLRFAPSAMDSLLVVLSLNKCFSSNELGVDGDGVNLVVYTQRTLSIVLATERKYVSCHALPRP